MIYLISQVFWPGFFKKNFWPTVQGFECKKCGKYYLKTHYLKQHLSNVHGKRRDICNHCGQYFRRAESLKLHVVTCAQNLKKHIANSHEGQKHVENEGFKIMDNLQDKKEHKCDQCGKSFARPESLKTHIYTIHEGRPDFKCEKCFKTFTQASGLKKHINVVHEGIKNHTCEACRLSFAQRGDLKKHIHTVHEGNKDYKCHLCVKAFSDGSSLKRHRNSVHEGLKDYNCHYLTV